MDRLCALNPKLKQIKFIYDHVIRGNVRLLRRVPRSLLSTSLVDHSIHNGHLDVVEWCCYVKVFPSIEGIKFAATRGHVRILEFLYKHEVSLSAYDPHLLDEVAINGHAEALRFLYSTDPGLEMCSSEAFEEAERRGHEEVVKFLLEVGWHHACVERDLGLPAGACPGLDPDLHGGGVLLTGQIDLDRGRPVDEEEGVAERSTSCDSL